MEEETMVINHNISALNTLHQLNANNAASAKSLQKLSSGMRINSAADDAAGLAISEKMRGQISGLDQATRNGQDGISLIQTAEGGLNETTSILQRMRELAVQSANDTNTDSDRAQMQKEVDQLTQEINTISTDTQFNTKNLLDGSMGNVFAPTVTSATLQNLQATGSNLTTGVYTLSMTAAGADTFGSFNSSLNAQVVSGDLGVQAGAHIKYGNYRLAVTNYNGVSHSADLALTGPDGTLTMLSGQDMTSNVAIGGITVATGTHAITQNGMAQFALTDNGLDVDLTAAANGATVNAGAIAAYAGQALSVGGFQFSVLTNHGANGTAVTGSLTNNAILFQIGANAGQNTTLSINNMSAQALGVSGSGSVGGTSASGIVTGGTSGSTNLVETDGANIGSTSITGTPAFEADGKNITLTYAAGSPGSGGTEANLVCDKSTAVDLKSLLSPASDAQISISIDGGAAYIVTAAQIRSYNSGAGVQNGTDMYQELYGHGMLWTNMWKDIPAFPNWGIRSLSSGSSQSVKVDVTGSSAVERAAIETYFGMSGDSITAQGSDGTPPTSSTVTISDGSGNSAVVNVNDADTALAGTGYFSGLSVNLASGKHVTDLDGAAASKISFNNVTTPATPPVVSSVSFGSGLGSKITNGANLTFTYSTNAVTISDGTPADNQTVAVTSTDTSFAVSSGNYQGMTVNLAPGKTVSNLTSGTDGVSVSLSASGGGAAGGIDISTQTGAEAAISVVDGAIASVSSERAKLGAMQNRLEHTVNNLGTTSQNLTASESQIRDVDMAAEMMQYTKNNILSQAATAMMAQANQMPQEVLQLLK